MTGGNSNPSFEAHRDFEVTGKMARARRKFGARRRTARSVAKEAERIICRKLTLLDNVVTVLEEARIGSCRAKSVGHAVIAIECVNRRKATEFWLRFSTESFVFFLFVRGGDTQQYHAKGLVEEGPIPFFKMSFLRDVTAGTTYIH